jgi:Ca2+:H+ antiporter
MAVALASLIIPATLYAILHTSELDSAKHILFLSRGAAIILLIVYCLYLYFQLRFHANFLDIEQGEGEDTEESSEGQVLGPIAAGVALLLVTFIMTLCAAYFVDSIDPIAERGHFSKLFVGFILIPMVGSAADPATAVFIAYKDKIDLAINIAIRRSVQIALFVTPFMVILGWVIDQAMTLHFQGFETIVFFLSLLVVSYLVQDGKSKHLASAMCIGT